MIRITEIDSLLGLVGWRQSTITADAILDAGNIASSSGLYVNDISGLFTTANIKSTQEDRSISDSNFNTMLDNRQKSSFVNLLKSVLSDNDLIENRILFPYENDWTKTLTNDTSFVGYEISVAKQKDINAVINKIMLEFSAIDTVKILLFHSSMNALQDSESITTVADSTKHTALNWNLPAANSVVGGKWYIGYLRSGLTASAYDRDYESANVKTPFNCIGIKSIKVDGWDAETLFDVNDVEYTSETWGINLDISCLRDFTSLVVENKDRFARGLQLQIAADLLNLMATTTRSNANERRVNMEALFALNGNRNNPEIPYSVGVLNQLNKEIDDLRKMFVKPKKIQIDTIR